MAAEAIPVKTELDYLEANQESWFMCDEVGPVYLASITTYGTRADGSALEAAGSVSPVWGQPELAPGQEDVNLGRIALDMLSETHRAEVMGVRRKLATEKIERFLERYGVQGHDVAFLRIQDGGLGEDMRVTDADSLERQAPYACSNETAAMIYSNDPDRVLALDVGDCAAIIGYGQKPGGHPLLFMIHAGWQDANAGYVEKSLAYVQDKLGFSLKEMNYSIAPAAFDLSYVRQDNPEEGNDSWFNHPGWKTRIHSVKPVSDGRKYEFKLDTHGFIMDRFAEFGVQPEQIYVDSSDTTRQDSGYSSHSRWFYGAVNAPTRGLILAMTPEYAKNAAAHSAH